jgi:transcriptional repressor NrdR
MFCVNCFYKTTAVANSRPHKKQPQIWRRRTCPKCGEIFTTYERPSLAENKRIHLPSGDIEVFNLGKLIISIHQAFSHNPAGGAVQALWLAQTVEDTLSTEHTVITPDEIAAVTHQTLKRFDEMAAMQYAIQHTLITSTRRRPGRPSLA